MVCDKDIVVCNTSDTCVNYADCYFQCCEKCSHNSLCDYPHGDYYERGVMRMYYSEQDNLFYDEDGITIYDIYKYVTPSDIYLFKRGEENVELDTKYGMVDLYYPEEFIDVY